MKRPFLTAADTARLDIRGSRDPLGIAALWSNVGRHVVGNLTTASATVRGFTTTMLGYHYAEVFAPSGRNKDEFRIKAFLKFEQLAAYARCYCNNDGKLRGILEVRRRLAEAKPITISADSAGQILSNQKIYGLWGLYSVPSRESGILMDSLTLTPGALEFLQKRTIQILRDYAPGVEEQIRRILVADRSTVEPHGKDAELFRALARTLRKTFTAAERAFYRNHLINGDGRSELQPQLARLIDEHLDAERPFDLDSLKLIISKADQNSHDELTHRLRNILHLEAIQIPMALLFAFLQANDGRPFDDVAKDVESKWQGGLKHINPEAIADMQMEISRVFGSTATGNLFGDIAVALRNGRYSTALELVLQQNAFIMGERGGAGAWIVVNKGKLDVRYREANLQSLPTIAEMSGEWRNSFYIDPLKEVIDELREAA